MIKHLAENDFLYIRVILLILGLTFISVGWTVIIYRRHNNLLFYSIPDKIDDAIIYEMSMLDIVVNLFIFVSGVHFGYDYIPAALHGVFVMLKPKFKDILK